MTSNEALYQARSRAAIARRDSSIPKEFLLPESALSALPKNLTDLPSQSDHFTSEEREIITSSATHILKQVRSKAWKSETVARAFCKSASVANQLTSCLTVATFDTAIERAKELDEHISRTGNVVGPLHGLPISLKDCFITPPVPSTIGISAYAEQETKADEESVLVALLRDLGAVVHCKTNVPVGMMAMETDNNTFEATSNPHNIRCSPGGSSGGEGALIAMYGSPLGIGTDIGGSIRIPSAFSGLYGLKPSFSRFPTYGTRSGIPGNDYILSVNGPMARHLEDIETYTAALLTKHEGILAPWQRDPKCNPYKWQAHSLSETKGKKLKLGFMPPYDGVMHAHPPIIRALNLMRQSCERAGHECVTWEPTGHADLLGSVQAGFLGLGGPAIAAKLKETGEPFMPGMRPYEEAATKDPLTAEQLRQMNLVRNAHQKKYLDRWHEMGVDAIVAPASPWSAVRKGFTTRDPGIPYYGFTAIFSLLDVPGVTLPVTTVDKSVDGPWTEKPEPFNDPDAKVIDDWNPEVYDGTPVGVQIIGDRLEEERLLGIAKELEKALDTGKS